MDQLLGSKYTIGEQIGRGGMGQVFRGSIRENGAPVAVKLLKPELLSDPDIVARFFRERSILLSTSHPNVARVIDLVVEGQTLAIVMELIDGLDLRRELTAKGTLAPAEAVRYGRELLDGLAAVHEAGIVHRDVKPENLLVDTSGDQPHIKLTDFGIARLTYGGSLTRLSSVIGTPEYMAPEIADHDTATPAADLYSTGIVLYEMLAGRTPFAGGHALAVLHRHLTAEPPPIQDAPPVLWALIDSLLAKDPACAPVPRRRRKPRSPGSSRRSPACPRWRRWRRQNSPRPSGGSPRAGRPRSPGCRRTPSIPPSRPDAGSPPAKPEARSPPAKPRPCCGQVLATGCASPARPPPPSLR